MIHVLVGGRGVFAVRAHDRSGRHRTHLVAFTTLKDAARVARTRGAAAVCDMGDRALGWELRCPEEPARPMATTVEALAETLRGSGLVATVVTPSASCPGAWDPVLAVVPACDKYSRFRFLERCLAATDASDTRRVAVVLATLVALWLAVAGTL